MSGIASKIAGDVDRLSSEGIGASGLKKKHESIIIFVAAIIGIAAFVVYMRNQSSAASVGGSSASGGGGGGTITGTNDPTNPDYGVIPLSFSFESGSDNSASVDSIHSESSSGGSSGSGGLNVFGLFSIGGGGASNSAHSLLNQRQAAAAQTYNVATTITGGTSNDVNTILHTIEALQGDYVDRTKAETDLLNTELHGAPS